MIEQHASSKPSQGSLKCIATSPDIVPSTTLNVRKVCLRHHLAESFSTLRDFVPRNVTRRSKQVAIARWLLESLRRAGRQTCGVTVQTCKVPHAVPCPHQLSSLQLHLLSPVLCPSSCQKAALQRTLERLRRPWLGGEERAYVNRGVRRRWRRNH
jgi:hypothetical protein